MWFSESIAVFIDKMVEIEFGDRIKFYCPAKVQRILVCMDTALR